MNSASLNTPAWTGATITLPGASINLQSASSYSFQMKTLNSTETNYNIYLQLGVTDSSTGLFENETSIPTWLIVENGNLTNEWQTITVYLSPLDRQRLTQNQNARIIITENTPSGNSNGSIEIMGSPTAISGISFDISSPPGISVNSIETISPYGIPSDAEVFVGNNTNYVENISWTGSIPEC